MLKKKLIKDVGCKQGSVAKLEAALTIAYGKTMFNQDFKIQNSQHADKLSEEEKKF
eukprot:TRINITY_DN660_c0_g2_i1.p2 TRINITY_DN660_c0_g2~~TRINITY_DN660_c0_g2_i1.p2  ORF type:complete len:56 (+),score=12.40 TRINITY_DN660_c0_g2_i1:61-228(+)